MGRVLYTTAAAFLLAGCIRVPYEYEVPASQPPQTSPPPQTQYPPQKTGCPIAGSSDWAAWVNAMPGPGATPTLIITGKVTVPTGGYRFAWRDVRVMESYPVQVVAELDVFPPTQAATQAIVTHDVRGQWPISPPVGSVTVSCGGQTLAAISPVQTAH
jgi:hypothetical protein